MVRPLYLGRAASEHGRRTIGGATRRKIIVHIATSADGYIARPNGDLDWLTNRPAPAGFYGLPKFERTVDAKILGRKTFEMSVALGATFRGNDRYYVFSRRPTPDTVPPGVEFVTEPIDAFVARLRQQPGKHLWMMGGGEIIASFLDAGAIDEIVITMVPMFIGEGIPLIAPRHRDTPLHLENARRFPDGMVQLHYRVEPSATSKTTRPTRPARSPRPRPTNRRG